MPSPRVRLAIVFPPAGCVTVYSDVLVTLRSRSNRVTTKSATRVRRMRGRAQRVSARKVLVRRRPVIVAMFLYAIPILSYLQCNFIGRDVCVFTLAVNHARGGQGQLTAIVYGYVARKSYVRRILIVEPIDDHGQFERPHVMLRSSARE